MAVKREQSRVLTMWLCTKADTVQTSLADMLSVLAMTSSNEDKPDLLKYRLLAPTDDIGQWGHEYTRHLALESMDEYHNRLITEIQDEAFEEIWEIGRKLAHYFLKHNAEADAVDLLSDLEIIDEIEIMVDKDSYERVCLYMVRYARGFAYRI